jgi:hypothetical protein
MSDTALVYIMLFAYRRELRAEKQVAGSSP